MEPRSSNSQPRSILESKGEEVTAIITPVSICIALTVALVKTLNPSGASRNRAISIAAIYYSEEVGSLPTQCGIVRFELVTQPLRENMKLTFFCGIK
jgi:hypothetical protein